MNRSTLDWCGLRSLAAAAVTLLGAFGTPGISRATPVEIHAIPTAWRLQDYGDPNLYVYFTGAKECQNGALWLNSALAQNSKDRFWSLIMSAKISKSQVGLVYESTTCQITTFFLLEE